MTTQYEFIVEELRSAASFMTSLDVGCDDSMDAIANDVAANVLGMISQAPRPMPMGTGALLIEAIRESHFADAIKQDMHRAVAAACAGSAVAATPTDVGPKHSFAQPMGVLAYMTNSLWHSLLSQGPSFNTKLQELVDFLGRGGMNRCTPKTAADIVAVVASCSFSSPPDSVFL